MHRTDFDDDCRVIGMIVLKTKVVSMTHTRIISENKTRQGDARKRIRKLAGYFIL
jgi:hypothetical protein